METLLYINSNIDTHTDYTKTRVADQAGNFIINGQHEYSSDYKFRTGKKTTGSSLKFPSNEDLYITDHYNVFNFGPRDFSIRTWVKFDDSLNNSDSLFSKNVILSKWSDDFTETETNKVFRFSYVRDNTNPEKSYLSFEYAGPKGYANENFPTLNLIGTDVGMYDGTYNKADIESISADFKEHYHIWQKNSDQVNSDLLVMKKRKDPTEFENINKSAMDVFRKNNLVGEFGFLNWEGYGDNIEDWKTGTSPYEIATPTRGKSSFTNQSAIVAKKGDYVFSFSISINTSVEMPIGDFNVYLLNRKILNTADINESDIIVKKSKNEITTDQNNFYFNINQDIETLYILLESDSTDVSDPQSIKLSALSLQLREQLANITSDQFFVLKYENGEYDESSFSENVSKFIEVGHHHKLECGDLNDGQWHYLYTSCFYKHEYEKNDANAKIHLGVDDIFYEEERIRENISPTINYIDNTDGTSDRTLYLSAVSPHFEKTSHGEYTSKLSTQNVYIGSDSVNSHYNFSGKIDTLVVDEFTLYENEELYKLAPSNEQPKCLIDALSNSVVGFYDENTHYFINELDTPEEMDITIFEPTHADEDSPTTSLAVYKKQLGNTEYLSSITESETEITDDDLNKWKWELKFMNPPVFLVYTQEQLDEWEQKNRQKDALL
jgi:hypothetical protein